MKRFDVKSSIIWPCLLVILFASVVPLVAVFEFATTGTVDFARPSLGRAQIPIGWLYTIGTFAALFELWKQRAIARYYLITTAFSLSDVTLEVRGSKIPVASITSLSGRPEKDDFLIVAADTTVSFHPHFTRGGLGALTETLGDRLELNGLNEEQGAGRIILKWHSWIVPRWWRH